MWWNSWAEKAGREKSLRINEEEKRFQIMCYPISLEVNEDSSSDLGNQDKQEECEILWETEGILQINGKTNLKFTFLQEIHNST